MHIKNRYHCTLCMYISIYIYIYILNNPRFWSHQVYVYYKYYTAPKPSHLFRSLHKLPCDSKARRVLRKIVRRFIILWYATFCVIDYEKQNKTKKRSKRNVVRVLKKRWRKNKKKKEYQRLIVSTGSIDRSIDPCRRFPSSRYTIRFFQTLFFSDTLIIFRYSIRVTRNVRAHAAGNMRPCRFLKCETTSSMPLRIANM